MGWLNINGNWIGRHSGKSWSSYWMNRSLFWGKGRSGLTIPATIGSNASILPVCGKMVKAAGIPQCSYLKAPNSTKDLTFNEMTIEAIVEFNTLPTENVQIFGRNKSGSAEGDVSLYITFAGGNNITFMTYDTSFLIKDTVTIETGVKYHIIGTIKPVVGMKLYINEVDKGVDTYRAVAASADEPFCAGAQVVATGPQGFGNMNFYTARLYNVCLTAEELTSRWAGTDITRGLILCWDFMGGHGSITEHDRSGQSNHGTWVGTQPTYYTYSANGCQDNLDNGYKRYHKLGAFPLYLPKLIGSNNYPASPSFPAGYAEWGEIAGSALVHNLAASKIRLPNHTVFSRDNVTTNTATSRAATDYDAANVRDWHIWEAATFNIITSYLNSGYQGMMFPKNTWFEGLDGISRPVSLDELILTSTDQTGNALTKALRYTDNE